MPHEAPGVRHTAVATKDCVHGQIVSEDNFVGSAFKVAQIDRFTRPADAQDIIEDEEFEIQIGGVHETAASGPLAGADVNDKVWIDPTDNSLALSAGGTAAVKASLATGTVGANNGITWTAREPGDDGEDITIALVFSDANVADTTVDVDQEAITVTLESNDTGAGTILATAAEVIAAINEHDVASQLVDVANTGASNGSGVVAAVAATPLAGGAEEDAGDRLPVGVVSEVDTSRTPDVLRINSNAWQAFLPGG